VSLLLLSVKVAVSRHWRCAACRLQDQWSPVPICQQALPEADVSCASFYASLHFMFMSKSKLLYNECYKAMQKSLVVSSAMGMGVTSCR
jgi:hypothetical protein